MGRARWLRLLPGLLLAAVALHQVWLARTQGLSAWSGGGFGMFSTVDAGATRHLHAFAIRPGVLRELRPPPSLEKRVLRTLALPSGANLRGLALHSSSAPSRLSWWSASPPREAAVCQTSCRPERWQGTLRSSESKNLGLIQFLHPLRHPY